VQDKNQSALQSFKGDFDTKAQRICDEMLQFRSTVNSMQSDLENKAKEYAEVLQKVRIQVPSLIHESCTHITFIEFIHHQ
jgi:hypothetical protein